LVVARGMVMVRCGLVVMVVVVGRRMGCMIFVLGPMA